MLWTVSCEVRSCVQLTRLVSQQHWTPGVQCWRLLTVCMVAGMTRRVPRTSTSCRRSCHDLTWSLLSAMNMTWIVTWWAILHLWFISCHFFGSDAVGLSCSSSYTWPQEIIEHVGVLSHHVKSLSNFSALNAFSDFSLLMGRQEEHAACKKVMSSWHGYLCGAWCIWLAYVPADATATPSSPLQQNPECFMLLVPAHLCSPRQRAVKQFLVVVVMVVVVGAR